MKTIHSIILVSFLIACNQPVEQEILDEPTLNYSTLKNKQVAIHGFEDYGSSLIISNNTLWVSGYNGYGELGLGTDMKSLRFMPVADQVDYVVSTFFYSIILKTDATVWASGQRFQTNTYKQIMSDAIDIAAAVNFSYILKQDHSLWQRESSEIFDYQFMQVLTDVIQIEAAFYTCLALKSDKTLWGISENKAGQLGDSTRSERSNFIQIMTDVQSFSTGNYSSMVIKTDSSLWVAGSNAFGQLGDGSTNYSNHYIKIADQVISARVGFLSNFIIKSDHSLWTAGLNSSTNTLPDSYSFIKLLDNVYSIAVSESHLIVQKLDGSLWALGNNSNGQLGEGINGYTTDWIKL